MGTAKNPNGLWARKRANDKPYHVFCYTLTLPSSGCAYCTVCLPHSMERGQDFNKVSSVSIHVCFQQLLERDKKKKPKRDEAKKRKITRMLFTVDPG